MAMWILIGVAVLVVLNVVVTYNGLVRRPNRVANAWVQSFPSNILAGMFGFKEHEYFEADGTSRRPVSVQS